MHSLFSLIHSPYNLITYEKTDRNTESANDLKNGTTEYFMSMIKVLFSIYIQLN